MRIITLILLLLFCGLQSRLWHGAGSMQELRFLQDQVAQQKGENLRLLERNAELASDVQDLNQGLDAVEERARHELGLIKPGETFYRIVAKE